MTPAQLKRIIGELGIKPEDMAELVGCKQRAIYYYLAGERKIPEPTARLIHRIAEENKCA